MTATAPKSDLPEGERVTIARDHSHRPRSLLEKAEIMRSFFIAIGLFVCLWGGVFLLVDEMVLSSKSSLFSVELLRGWWTTWDDGRHAAFHPPEWAAFSLLSIGSLMMVYAIGLPPRTNNTPVRSLLDRNERRFHFAQNSHWSR